MTTGPEGPMPSLTEAHALDRALDALGRGGSAPEDDALLGILSAWREDLAPGEPGDVRLRPVTVPTPLAACAPPLTMFIIGTGRMCAFGPPR